MATRIAALIAASMAAGFIIGGFDLSLWWYGAYVVVFAPFIYRTLKENIN
jgi:hypothetical protein